MIDHDAFRAVMGRFASGVTVVTSVDADGFDEGMTVSAFCSLSLDPPMVLFAWIELHRCSNRWQPRRAS